MIAKWSALEKVTRSNYKIEIEKYTVLKV